jgi:hypothetical protein
MKTDIETQKAKILNYIYGTFRKINAPKAYKLCGTMKLSTRIGEIEKEHNITVERERIPGTNYMRYWVNTPKAKVSC